MSRFKKKLAAKSAMSLIIYLLLVPVTSAVASFCWIYATQSAVNPQPWVTTNLSPGCSTSNFLHAAGSTTGQAIGEEHRNWHCAKPVAATETYGRAFLAFHRQFINDFDNYRLSIGLTRLELWDPFEDALVPGNDETTTSAFTNCSDANFPNPGDNIRPAGAVCAGCSNLPAAYIGSNLNNFNSLGEVGHNLDTGINAWHGSYHNGVQGLGCDDIGGFLHTPRDPAFWMAHKKLDEIARDWQSLQATDTVIVIDRSGSMDDNCSSSSPPPGESPCAINDAREAARTFANLVLDVRMDSGAPTAEQHRIGLVSFASTSTPELSLTPANGIISDDGIDNTPFEIALAGISTAGATSVASGIREAMTILNAVADPNSQQAILVLTDGKENTVPCLGGNSPSSCTPGAPGDTLTVSEVGDVLVVAVGFGAGAEEGNLRDVAERHGGIFVAEADVSDALSLQKFFVTGFGEIYDAGVSSDPRGIMSPGQEKSKPFEIQVSGDDERLSVVMGREEVGQGAECDLYLELFTPSGEMVRRSAKGVEAGHGLRHDFIHVNLPYREEWQGTWFRQIVRPANGSPRCEPQEYFYSVLTKGFGRIDPLVVRPNLILGRRVLATFRISESNRPLGGFDKVNARVTLTRPNGSPESHEIFDDGTNGDILADNHIWSYEFPNPTAEPGAYHLLGHFEIIHNGFPIVREAEYSIVVDREPDVCTKPVSGGILNGFVQHKPRPGDIVKLAEVACFSNVCGASDQYQLAISDSQNWLRTIDPSSGKLVELPRTLETSKVAGFSFQCFGRGPSEEDKLDNIPLFAIIPPDAKEGDITNIDIRVHSLGTAQQLPPITSVIEVAPMPDCNENGLDDGEDIASGFSHDENGNGVPDECDVAGHFHHEKAVFLPIVNGR